MSTVKNAVLRYLVLDRCFSNFGRKYSFNDLLIEVNHALFEHDPNSTGIQERQLRDDIAFMRSNQGYTAPIDTKREGKSFYYRYEDKDYSINSSPLNKTEAEQLRSSLSVLQRFQGTPGFEWLNEMAPMLESQFGLKASTPVMGFESNIDYSGYRFITPIFNAITNQRVLEVEYQPFRQETEKLILHPYYLKQYNNRWFALGYNEEKQIETWNIALDRIQSIKELTGKYQTCNIDWEEDHFYDLIGVTKKDGDEPETVHLVFAYEQAPYVETKPLHASQKHKYLEDGSLDVRIEVEINYELETLILSFGEKVKIVSPINLKDHLAHRLKEAGEQY